jgi:hypothetical protein
MHEYTTKKQRERWAKRAEQGEFYGPPPLAGADAVVSRLITHLEAALEALEEAHEDCLDCEKALPCKARAVLEEPE